jgi:bifunctional UDP-N-acetylglucosamine pyrophosphorylase/glucosamine-1-phosphate N-acetyltransferase
MKSDLPKVLHRLGGKTLVEWVLGSVSAVDVDRRLVIVGYRSELIKQAFAQSDDGNTLEFVEQREQLGTGTRSAAAIVASG